MINRTLRDAVRVAIKESTTKDGRLGLGSTLIPFSMALRDDYYVPITETGTEQIVDMLTRKIGNALLAQAVKDTTS